MAQEEEKKKKTIDRIIDFIFSNDERRWLILIFLIGVILRFIVASNIAPLGDEAVHGPHAIGFLHSGLISTILHSPLWFYLTDIALNIFGITMFSTRFLSFFYSSLSIIVIYLIASKIYGKKVGLISAFLIAVSYYIIRYTLMEMDLSALFFLILAIYLFIVSLEKNKFPYTAAICIGLASLIKTLSLFFVPAFLIGFFLLNKKSENKRPSTKENIKKTIYFGIIITLIFSPILIHNYLWFTDKGMVDSYFAQYFNIGQAREAYSGQIGYDNSFDLLTIPERSWGTIKSMFSLDPILMIFGILGIIFSFLFSYRRRYGLFLILFELSGFFFLKLSNNGLTTHYTTMMPVLCIFGGFFLDHISEKISTKTDILSKKNILILTLCLIFIFQIYLLLPHLTSSCGMCKLRNYAIENMDKNSIVVADSRIYRGRIAWLFSDFHYLESSYLSEILKVNEGLSGQNIPVKLYFVEAATDDSGWGSIKDQPELNKSTEEIVSYFSSTVKPEKIIYGGGGYGEVKGETHFIVYSTTIDFKPQIIQIIDSTHSWFYYPINYIPKDKIFDTYNVNGIINSLIYKFAWLITFFSVIAAILFAIIPFIELLKDNS